MKTRFKITFTITIDYEVNPENYPGCDTDEERLAIDLKNAEDDPFMMIANDADWKLTGEIVKEGAQHEASPLPLPRQRERHQGNGWLHTR